MTAGPGRDALHGLLRLREKRERRARTELARGVAAEASAVEAAEIAARALSLEHELRQAREAQMYRDMLGRALSPRDIDAVEGRLRRFGADLQRYAAEADGTARIAEERQREAEIARREFRELHRARCKWEKLTSLDGLRRDARQALVDEWESMEAGNRRARA